ncbi:hypothetical protein GCM10009601_36800 [Streptomyces thermospinosisporus]|uniref:Uncharacterized protein n=1 Tax=Streptomyces thermospinosisporus TaxID=161482 RepID=A0ABN1Z4H0_9ACTN
MRRHSRAGPPSELRKHAVRGASHGLWMPLPVEDPLASPSLDGRTVEVVDRSTEWEVLACS